ncbi:MAG TPA: methyltransferase domain-containing protein [Vicinamibacterales bacterium]|nr:methyltransferase domain-containing protein [Vicinamibacterales bacterium]
MWNRIRYTLWAPFYDPFVAAVGFDALRRQSIDHLRLRAGDRVLISGAGTGQDLPHLPAGVEVTAIDVTPAMLARLKRRASDLGLTVDARVMDARRLEFEDARFDAIILHLILAVMPEPDRGLAEAIRVLRPGGRIAVFDKFLGDEQEPSIGRRLLNLMMKPLCTDMNRRFGPLVRPTGLIVERDEPAAFGGMYRLITLRKPDQPDHPGDRRS